MTDLLGGWKIDISRFVDFMVHTDGALRELPADRKAAHIKAMKERITGSVTFEQVRMITTLQKGDQVQSTTHVWRAVEKGSQRWSIVLVEWGNSAKLAGSIEWRGDAHLVIRVEKDEQPGEFEELHLRR